MHQEAVDLRAGLDRREIRVERRLDPLAAFGGGVERRPQCAQQGIGVALGERTIEAALVAEVPVQDGLGDAGLGRDGVHRRLGPVPEHHAVGGLQQLPAALFGRGPLSLGLSCGLHVASPHPWPCIWPCESVTHAQRNTLPSGGAERSLTG